MEQAQARPVDDEGLPRPPPVHGKLPRLLVKIMVKVETATFMAVAIARANRALDRGVTPRRCARC
jgi:hypothetical protein